MSFLGPNFAKYWRQNMSQSAQSKKRFISPTQNIKVVVRVRPLNNEEKEKRVKNVVNCISNREVQTRDNKKYQFDRVFQPNSTQMDVYLYVVAPMISDVLAGYNCTVFAYGQTGTGKTHTMTGGDPSLNVHWKHDDLAGCIPRAAANIFDEIGLMDTVDYNVRVSFLELYNEEVRDLLSEEERPPPLNIFNDSKGSVYIQGLNEITVSNSNDIYILLQQGTCKRQTASTLMNNHSSRSHTVFTITVHTRETTITGEEVLKTGKINLVDLAGSENIAKSGAKDKRAVELANINKSLLTLGRVIQILADKNNKHIPYRDSKLTRILQDSLGGHTKTCIIATVSPSHTSYEETTSTLDYACRARDIRNTPTINEKVTKAQMMKEMTHEIEKLKKDLDAARSGDGFFIDRTNWEQLNLEIQNSSNALSLKNEIIDEMKKKLTDLELMRDTKLKEFEYIMNVFKKKEKEIDKAKTLLKEQKVSLKQEQYVSKCYAAAATETTVKAKELLEATKKLSNNQEILQRKLENQYFNNYKNEQTIKEKSANLTSNLNTALENEYSLKNVTKTDMAKCRYDISSIKSTSDDIIQSFSHTWENERRPPLDLLLKNQINLIQDTGRHVGSVVDLSNQAVDNVLGLVNNSSSACLEISENFKHYDKNVSLHTEAMSKLLNSIQAQLIKEREQVLQDLERFKEFAQNRVCSLDSILSTIENSKESWQCGLRTTENIEKKAKIEEKFYEVTKTNESIIMEMHSEKTTMEKFLQFSIEREQEMLTCSQKLEEVGEVVSNDLKDMKTISEATNLRLENLGQTFNNIEDTIENHVTEACNFIKHVDDTVTKDIIKNIIPVKRMGDTPKQNSFNYPKRIGEGVLPREVLIKKFKEEVNEDIENESFHLNVSADSIQALDDSIDTTSESEGSLVNK